MKLFTRPPPSLTIRQARVSHKLSLQLCRDTQVIRSPVQPRRSLLNLKSFSFWGELLRGASIWFTSCGRTPDQKREREKKKTQRERERDKGKRKKSVVKSSKQNSPALRGCITAVTDRVRVLKRHFFVKQKCAPQFIHGTDITVFPHFLLFCFLFLLFFHAHRRLFSWSQTLETLRRQGFMYWKNEVLSPLSEGNKILSEGIPTKQVLTRNVWAFFKKKKGLKWLYLQLVICAVRMLY